MLNDQADKQWPSSLFQVHQAFWSFSSHPLIMVEYYQVLGVQKDASADDIKKAWVEVLNVVLAENLHRDAIACSFLRLCLVLY